MNTSVIYDIANKLPLEEKKVWQERLYATMQPLSKDAKALQFPNLVVALIMCGKKEGFLSSENTVIYGAGLKAKRNISKINRHLKIAVVWDTNAKDEKFEGYPLTKPFTQHLPVETLIIICVAKRIMQREIEDTLRQHGYNNIMTIQQYLNWEGVLPVIQELAEKITKVTLNQLEKLYEKYEIIQDVRQPVLFSVLPNSLKLQGSYKTLRQPNFLIEEICKGLFEKLLLNAVQKESILDYVRLFVEEVVASKHGRFSFYNSLETVLRNVLEGRIKTKYRPIRMQGDDIYDQCAAFEVCCVIYEACCKHDMQLVLETLRESQSFDFGLMTRILTCHYLLKASKLEEALEAGRKLMVDAPNDFLASEVYCDALYACRKHGIGNVSETEAVPDYDLRERFCWSGLSFAWCGGFIGQEQRAYFQPCFRPGQCAAKPEGKTWTSWEWQEFRKSLVDGSFRYCQKNQCPNLVSGWLPNKEKCKDERLQEIFRGNYEVLPDLNELHFSYDRHCNLCCPSCRTEFDTNETENNDRLDALYDRNLQPLLSSAHHLCLSGCGEALLSPHSRRIIMGLVPGKYPNLEIELRTNMTVLNEKNWLSLGEGRKTIKHIAASIDAAKKETFEYLRYPAKWDTVLDNLKFVQKLRQQNEIEMFEFHVVVQEKNVDELIDIIWLAQSLDVDTVTFSKVLNWRDIPVEVYHKMNPFYIDNYKHEKLIEALRKITELHKYIESDDYLKEGKKRMYINMHGLHDPSDRYDEIRYGKYIIR